MNDEQKKEQKPEQDPMKNTASEEKKAEQTAEGAEKESAVGQEIDAEAGKVEEGKDSDKKEKRRFGRKASKEEEKIAALEKEKTDLNDKFLRICAEYDNFRKRSRKEREDLYTTIRAETVAKFLPVFDDLERALHNETVDEAYKKGVELTMTELRKIMTGLGVEEFGEVGDTFDPNAHNAVMHVEDESLGENTLAQIFQKGFRIGEKVIRFAVVKVAN